MHVQRTLDEVSPGTVSAIVVMGIGNQIDNYDNVIKCSQRVNSDKGLVIGLAITVSTSGFSSKDSRVFVTKDYKNLALSLHAPVITIHRSYHASTVNSPN